MEAAHILPPTTDSDQLQDINPADLKLRPSDKQRRCLVTGEVRPKTELLRFVVGPDAFLVPDLAQNLPGRGLWVVPEREALIAALGKNLFSKAAKTVVKIAPDFLDILLQLMRKRCLNFLGLAKRSAIAVLGQPHVETAIRARNLKLLCIANDASEKGVQDVLHMHALGNLPILRTFNREELGVALGYAQVVYVGLQSHALTTKFHAETTALDKIAGTAQFTAK